MNIYLKTEELKSALQNVIELYVQDCLTSKKLPTELTEIIKHNYLAKYVHYNDAEKMIEIGINYSEPNTSTYPRIKVFSFPIEKTAHWLDYSFKTGKGDLEFYGAMLNRKNKLDSQYVVFV